MSSTDMPDLTALGRSVSDVAAARAYTRKHFLIDDQTYVGEMRSADFDRAVDSVVDAVPKLLEEIERLRTVLVFADGFVLANNQRYGAFNFVLADLYAEDCEWAQGVIERAGCHARGKYLSNDENEVHSLSVLHDHDRCSCGWEGIDGQQHMADVIHAVPTDA